MKTSLALICLLTLTRFCPAQTNPRVEECEKAAEVDKSIDPSLYSETCSAIVRQLGPGEHVASVFDDGSFLTTDGIIHPRKLPGRIGSALLLDSSRKGYLEIESMAKSAPQGDPDTASALSHYTASALSDYRENLWPPIRDEFCRYHPGETYLELSNTEAVCTGTIQRITGQAGMNSAPTPSSMPTSPQGTPACRKAITFAQARNGSLAYSLPDVSPKWLDKAKKKYPNVCFLQYGAGSGQENYLIVLSSSSSAYDGLQPVFSRSRTTTPVSGSGTLTDSGGSTWTFTYQGTVTTTTTTQTSVPFTDTSAYFYADAYGEDGSLVGTSERSASSRQGGDPYNALGYNLTSGLLSIHLKEHLLENIVKKVSALP